MHSVAEFLESLNTPWRQSVTAPAPQKFIKVWLEYVAAGAMQLSQFFGMRQATFAAVGVHHFIIWIHKIGHVLDNRMVVAVTHLVDVPVHRLTIWDGVRPQIDVPIYKLFKCRTWVVGHCTVSIFAGCPALQRYSASHIYTKNLLCRKKEKSSRLRPQKPENRWKRP